MTLRDCSNTPRSISVCYKHMEFGPENASGCVCVCSCLHYKVRTSGLVIKTTSRPFDAGLVLVSCVGFRSKRGLTEIEGQMCVDK